MILAGNRHVASAYADFTSAICYDKLPNRVKQQAKLRILDLVGVSLAGCKLMDLPRTISGYLASLGGAPEATILKSGGRFPAVNAAFANAFYAHCLDMDDGHRFAALHPGAVVIPAAIAAAELSGATTSQLIAGVVAGYEVMIRIGMAINPSTLRRGFHATGTVGPFGAAAAASNIMRLSPTETLGAMGMAGLQGAGLLQVNHDADAAGAKPINPAKAAMAGVLSCVLAQRGARGPSAILEGEDGFLRAMADSVDRELLTRGLGQNFEIMNVYTKFYAACRHAHAPMDATLEAMQKANVSPEDIRRISVETYREALQLAGIRHPTTPSGARFSIPFSVALILARNGGGAEQYCESNVCDHGIQRLADMVEMSVGNEWEKLYPAKRGATVHLTDTANRTWSCKVPLAKGEPENPAAEEEIYAKFHTNATLLVSQDHARLLRDGVMSLENIQLQELIRLIQ